MNVTNNGTSEHGSRPGVLHGYITEADFCETVGISKRTARVWRQRRIGPPYVRLGGQTRAIILYSEKGVQDWLKAQEVQPVRNTRKASLESRRDDA